MNQSSEKSSGTLPHPAHTQLASLVICEKSGRWAERLKTSLLDKGFACSQIRSLAQCENQLSTRPHSFVVLEVTSVNLEPALHCLVQWARRFPNAPKAVVGDRYMQPAEALLREAGAIHTAFSPRNCIPLSKLVARHLRNFAAPPRSLQEEFFARIR